MHDVSVNAHVTGSAIADRVAIEAKIKNSTVKASRRTFPPMRFKVGAKSFRMAEIMQDICHLSPVNGLEVSDLWVGTSSVKFTDIAPT